MPTKFLCGNIMEIIRFEHCDEVGGGGDIRMITERVG